MTNAMIQLTAKGSLPPVQDIIEVDGSNIRDDTIVNGYVITGPTNGKNFLEPLLDFYGYRLVEYDGSFFLIKKGQDVDADFTAGDDHVLMKNGSVEITETVSSNIDLPTSVKVDFFDANNQLQRGHAIAKIIDTPSYITYKKEDESISLNMVEDLQTMKRFAEIKLKEIWSTPIRHEITTGRQIPFFPGNSYKFDLSGMPSFSGEIESIKIGDNLEQKIILNEISRDVYVSTADGDDDPTVVIPEFPESIPSIGYILDVPYIRDIDQRQNENTNSLLYWAAYIETIQEVQRWNGAVLMRRNPVSFSLEQLGNIKRGVTRGLTRNALADPQQLYRFDQGEIHVFLPQNRYDQMVSLPDVNLLQGENMAALIKGNGEVELIQYGEAEFDPSGGYWILSRLLRGRRGTSTMAYGHTNGEVFLLLTEQTISDFLITTGELVLHDIDPNDNTYTIEYASVSVGSSWEDSEKTRLAAKGRPLMPYPVVHIAARREPNNDIVFSWIRQTRIAGRFLNGPVPLNEQSERYDIEIIPSGGSNVIRRVDNLTLPNYRYGAGQQTADGLPHTEKEINVKIYQLSAIVGRGLSRMENVEIR